MIIVLNILIFILAIYLQSTLLARFDFFGLVPNLILILIVIFPLYRRIYEAYAFAFISGIILDSISGGPFGIHTATLMLAVFIISFLVNEDRSKITNSLMFILISICSVAFYLALWLIVSIEAKNFAFSGMFFILGQVLITVGFFILLFPFLKRLFLWEEQIEARRK